MHTPRRFELDGPHLLKLGEHARDGLECEPEIVGDVMARHGKIEDAARAGAAVHFQKKSGEAFERALEAFCAGGEPERLRLLAINSDRRHDKYPDVPTFKSMGIDIEAYLWVGLFTTAGIPEPTFALLRWDGGETEIG